MKKIVLLLALLAALTTETVAAGKIPILLDTDIGTDIDDAFAVALIVKSPELDLLGVTTVSGDTQARARLAAKLLVAAGRRTVPVYAGERGKPLPIAQTRWAEGFSDPQLHLAGAVAFLKSEFDRRPGEITLVAIGPLTNVGALLKQYPEEGKKIRKIVLMGGSLYHGYGNNSRPAAEYNIAQDPPAAQTVFASGVPIVMAPLDVTAMLQLDRAARQRIFTQRTPLTDALTLLYHLWGNSTPILFDPMAVALVIDPSLCQTRQLAVEVDAKGFTRVIQGRAPNVTAGLHTDPQKFFDFYLGRVAPESR